MTERYVTKTELAEQLGISVRTIDRYRQVGMPCLMMGRRSPRFKVSEVEQWLYTFSPTGRDEPSLSA